MIESLYQFLIEVFKVYVHTTEHDLIMKELNKIRKHYDDVHFSIKIHNTYRKSFTREEYIQHLEEVIHMCSLALEGISPDSLPTNRWDLRDIVREYTDKYIECAEIKGYYRELIYKTEDLEAEAFGLYPRCATYIAYMRELNKQLEHANKDVSRGTPSKERKKRKLNRRVSRLIDLADLAKIKGAPTPPSDQNLYSKLIAGEIEQCDAGVRLNQEQLFKAYRSYKLSQMRSRT